MVSPWPPTVTPTPMPADTAPLAVNCWVAAFELAVAPSVFVPTTVVVLAAQLTEFVTLGVALPVTSQAASAACGPANSIASAAVPASTPRRHADDVLTPDGTVATAVAAARRRYPK